MTVSGEKFTFFVKQKNEYIFLWIYLLVMLILWRVRDGLFFSRAICPLLAGPLNCIQCPYKADVYKTLLVD